MKYLFFLLISVLPTIGLAGYPYHNNQLIQVYQPNIIQRHSVEMDADTYLGLNGYLGTQDKLKLELLRQTDLDKESLKKLIELNKILAEKLLNGPQNQQLEKNPEKEEVKTNDLDRLTYEIFKKNCYQCHTEASNNGIKLITNSGGLYNLSALDRSNVYLRVTGDIPELGLQHMPKGGQKLSEKDIGVLRAWSMRKIQEEKK